MTYTRMFALTVLMLTTPAIASHKLNVGAWTLTVSPDGNIESLASQSGQELVPQKWAKVQQLRFESLESPPGSGTPTVAWSLREPTSVEPIKAGFAFEYAAGEKVRLRLRQEITFESVGGLPTLARRIVLKPSDPPFNQSLNLNVMHALMPSDRPEWFVPRQDGTAAPLGESDLRMLRYWISPTEPDNQRVTNLAIPMASASDPATGLRLTHVADPFEMIELRLDRPAGEDSEALSFVCPIDGVTVTLTQPLTRTFWTVIHDGPHERAMDAWYATALADVPPGPAWLHDVALHEYDYLSHGGKGWFEDIDVAEKLIDRADRSKVVFTLHGWYDMLGRYTFDATTGKLDDEWTAFPNAPAVKDRFPTSESVKMSKSEMHRRIRYAKDRGFRVCLYFGDGLTACEGAKLIADDKLVSWGGWEGPDTVGKPYMQNPDHPDVYKWFLDYHKALLAEYGSEIDALVWDETFMIRTGTIAPPHARRPAYLAPVFMRLVRDLTQATTRFNKELAFLTSDCQGMTVDDKTRWLDVPPCAIMAHGNYQDSHSRPSVWPYGIFANYRNVMWSCNWQAVTHFDYTRFGVEHYNTPIAVTNGWLDDKGLARLDESQLAAVMELFKQRKDKPQRLRWLTKPAPVFATKVATERG